MNYLIVGNSYKLIQNELNKIILNRKYKTYSMLNVTLSEVLIDASYIPLFDDEKIIVLKNFETIIDKKDDSLELLNNYLNEPSSTKLILISNTNIPSKSKLNKDLLSKLKVIEIKMPTKQYEIANFILELANKIGFRMEPSALNSFALKCTYNIDIALMELEKLKLMKNNNTITLNDIEELVPNYNADNIFDLKNAIVSRDIKKSNALLLEAETAKLEIIPIIVMLAKEYELLYAIKEISLENKTNEQIGSMLGGMHPYRVKMLRQIASKYTLDELKKLLLYLCNTDLRCVSEDNLGFLELKKFLLEL